MTEIYHGDWSSVTGDKAGKRVEDPYHPEYPDVGPYTKAEGILNKPLSGAYKVRDMSTTVSGPNGN